MTNPAKNIARASPGMTADRSTDLVEIRNAAKKALKPSSIKDCTVFNGLAIVAVAVDIIIDPVKRISEEQQSDTPLNRQPQGVHDGSGVDTSSSLAVQEAPTPVHPGNKQSIAFSSDGTGIEGPSAVVEKELLKMPKADQVQAPIFLFNDTPLVRTALPKNLDRIEEIPQLVFCLALLTKDTLSSPSGSRLSAAPLTLSVDEQAWISAVEQEPVKQHHMHWLVTRLVEQFIKDGLKGSASITEIIHLSPMLDQEHFCKLLCCFIAEFETAKLLNTDLLQGLVQLIQYAQSGYLFGDDLIKILAILRKRLEDMHQQSTGHQYHLVLAISRVLDVMVKHEVKGVNRVEQHKPLLDTLTALKVSSDPYLGFQAAYAHQALQYIPDDESLLKAFLRFAKELTMGLLGVASIFKLDPANLFTGLEKLMQAAGQASEVAKTTIEGVKAFRAGGEDSNDFLKGFREGKRQAWYIALQVAREFIREGQLAEFKREVFEAPCRREPDFQWGICHLLGEAALDSIREIVTRQQAVDFLVELYTENALNWGLDTSVKTWILTILRLVSDVADQITIRPSASLQQDINKAGVDEFTKSYLLSSRLPLPAVSPLLARVQDIPYVEYNLHQLKTQRIKEYSQAIYIPPLAKQASDKGASPLMGKIKEFLDSERQVFLVLGDSGAGKSTFNRHLENHLWLQYKMEERIPLYINLPSIDRPEKNLVAKQLLRHNFTEDQIQEMKRYRKFVLICDGYDESRIKRNLHDTNELNRPGQWDVKMVISCRSTYLRRGYQYRFQPRALDRYDDVSDVLFQEAVITPFNEEQIRSYVEQCMMQHPKQAKQHAGQWDEWHTDKLLLQDLSGQLSPLTVEGYMKRLSAIPNMMGLIQNPYFLKMSFWLDLSAIEITDLKLYDYFVDKWIQVNQTRLEESVLSPDREAELDKLIEAGFKERVVDFLKSLADAIYDEERGKKIPEVRYIQLEDATSWKEEFFGLEIKATLLRDASPLTTASIIHKFIHQSLLEYFYSLCVHDPDGGDEGDFDGGESNSDGDSDAPHDGKDISDGARHDSGGRKGDSSGRKDSCAGDKDNSRNDNDDSSGGNKKESGDDRNNSNGEKDDSNGGKGNSGGEKDNSNGDKNDSGGEKDDSGGDKNDSGGEKDDSDGDKNSSRGSRDRCRGDKDLSNDNKDNLHGSGNSNKVRPSVRRNPLAKTNLLNEPPVLQFLVERAQQDKSFRRRLLSTIDKSNSNVKNKSLAVANAITILFQAGERLDGYDLTGARIPGDYLSGAEFDLLQPTGADLTGVDFVNALRHAKFEEQQ
ncbi:hypothetical protein BGZ51_006955, partial [Haplosporangium sp. Z 767]